MNNMVCGMLITADLKRVALILKNRPGWQKGRLNGIGGHIESGETPMMAMIREFREETGVEIKRWTHFCSLAGHDWNVEWYKSFGYYDLKSTTDEKVQWHTVEYVVSQNSIVIPNVRWLLLMALENVKAQVDDNMP